MWQYLYLIKNSAEIHSFEVKSKNVTNIFKICKDDIKGKNETNKRFDKNLFIKFAIKNFVIESNLKMLSFSDRRTYLRTDGTTYGRTDLPKDGQTYLRTDRPT